MISKVTIGNKQYYCIELFMTLNSLKTRKSVYDWIKEGKAEKKKIGSASFFSKV